MAYPRKNLNESEQVVLDLNPHWFALALPGLVLAGAVVVGLVAAFSDWWAVLEWVAWLGLLAAVVWFGVRYAIWNQTNFVVTSDRLIFRSGVLSKHGIEIPLERVNNVIFHQTLFERMLGSGDLLIESAGESGQQSFSNIVNPDEVQNTIYRQIEANEERTAARVARAHREAQPSRPDDRDHDHDQDRDRESVRPASQASGTSIPEQIAQLAALRDEGLLTQAEFDAKKRDLLDRM